jgi:hypothetical protein
MFPQPGTYELIIVPGQHSRRDWALTGEDGPSMEASDVIKCHLYRGISSWVAEERLKYPWNYVHVHTDIYYEDCLFPYGNKHDFDEVLRQAATPIFELAPDQGAKQLIAQYNLEWGGYFQVEIPDE